MATRIQLRRGTAAEWTSSNPILLSGEIGVETDTGSVKIGNGSASWSSLNYFGADFAPLTVTINSSSVASYTLAVSDAGELLEINNAEANTLVVPLNSSVPFPVGTKIDVLQVGEGQVTASADSGVTINSKDGNTKLAGQWSAATLVKRGTDEWALIGDLSE